MWKWWVFLGLYVFKSTTLTFRISLRLLTQLKTLSGFTSGWSAHAQRETPLLHCPHPLINTSRATIAKRCVCFCASFLSSILIMCGCVLCVVGCGCAVQANQKRQTKATPTSPQIRDSKSVRPSVRTGAGVCCVRVRVRFMCGCGWVTNWF